MLVQRDADAAGVPRQGDGHQWQVGYVHGGECTLRHSVSSGRQVARSGRRRRCRRAQGHVVLEIWQRIWQQLAIVTIIATSAAADRSRNQDSCN